MNIKVNIPLKLKIGNLAIKSSCNNLDVLIHKPIFTFWMRKNYFCSTALRKIQLDNRQMDDIVLNIHLEGYNVFAFSSHFSEPIITEWKRCYHLSILHNLLRARAAILLENIEQ